MENSCEHLFTPQAECVALKYILVANVDLTKSQKLRVFEHSCPEVISEYKA